MSCRDVDAYHDGALSPRAAARFERHLSGCTGCQAALEATRAMVAGLATLPRVADADGPSEWTWRRIARQLDQPAPRSRWVAPLLIAAAAAAGFAVLLQRTPDAPPQVARPAGAADARKLEQAFTEVFTAEAELRRALAELDRVVESEQSTWPPGVAAQFADSSRQMDLAIARMREAALAAPGDAAAQESLYALYREKIDFVQEMVMRGGVL